MTVSQIYKEYLIESIIRKSLRMGTVLTEKEIQAELDEIIKKNKNLSSPFTSDQIYKIKEGEELSASKINTVFDVMYSDLAIAYKSLVQQSKDITSIYDSVISEFQTIEKRIKLLEEKTDSLMVISDNVDGYLDYVSDTFSNKDKVDTDRTTLSVDNKTGMVTLAPLLQKRISMPIIQSDLQFNVTTREQLKSVTLAPNSEMINAFDDTNSVWIHRVETGKGVGNMTADLIVRIPTSDAEISKILYRPSTSDTGNITSITIQYSDDGLNWYNVDGNGSGVLRGDVSLMFSPVKATYWKFVFNKTSYDEYRGDSYFYEFGAKVIQFYGMEYRKQENKLEGVLYSKVLKGKDSFNRVSLKVCEQLPLKTNINYEIAALTPQQILDYNSGTIGPAELDFHLIDPLDRDISINPKSIDFKNIEGYTGIGSLYDKDNVTDFRYKNNYNVLIDYLVPSNIVKSDLRILRNTGDNTLGASGEGLKVKKIDIGWAFDGTYYSANFYIHEESGKIVDFGDRSLTLDGNKISGKITIPKGFHKIKTHKNNWREILPAEITSTENIDILYPYNHKYLIEGISNTLYGEDMTVVISGKTKREIIDPDGVYTGVTRYWETTLEEVSDFNFVNNIDNEEYSVFSFIKDFNGDDRIMIKNSIEPGLLTNEKLAIITRAISGDLHEGIVLKVSLKSEDSKVTPVLDQYLVRLGL